MIFNYLIISLLFFTSNAQQNNVCKTMNDYKTIITNPNCWYNYIVDSTVPEIILKSGRPIEEFKATTSDGYILTLFRIPNTNSLVKKLSPIFLQHGMVTSCANWMAMGEDSLAFQLSNAGYDVWLGNYRGSQYSEEHQNLTVDNIDYWDYSIDEVALIDIPTMLKVVAKETNQGGNIIYIGHSLGNAVGVMYASEFPDEANKLLKLIVSLGPVYTLNMKSSLPKFVSNFAPLGLKIITHYGLTKYVSYGKITNRLANALCRDHPEMLEICTTSLFFIYGNKTGIKPEHYPLFWSQHPNGSAIKLIVHVTDFLQNRFRKYNYDKETNLQIYGQETPPDYDVSKIKTPVFVIYAINDWHSTKNDSIKLYNNIPAEYRYGIYEIIEENFNHLDFNFGTNTKREVTNYLLEVLKQI